MHDPRIGRFFAVDPLANTFPWNSPYAFSENSTIAFIELEGLEKYYAADGSYLGQVGSSSEIRVVNDNTIWVYFSTVRDAYSTGQSDIALGDGATIAVNDDLYSLTENNLLANSSVVYTDMENDIIKPWFSTNLPLSEKAERGMQVYQQTFTSWTGETFTGYIGGTSVQGDQPNPDTPWILGSVDVAGSELKIEGISSLNAAHSGWKVAALVHTHSNGSDPATFSSADMIVALETYTSNYMMEFDNKNSAYVFSSSKYREATNGTRHQWEGVDNYITNTPIVPLSYTGILAAKGKLEKFLTSGN